jgi:hypothetical protein
LNGRSLGIEHGALEHDPDVSLHARHYNRPKAAARS